MSSAPERANPHLSFNRGRFARPMAVPRGGQMGARGAVAMLSGCCGA